ncbi:MAG: ROK family protein [Pyrinomonadaceae bacterium]|nr:ROK family protein [Sphingobacteriaceae bacterium]
MRNESLVIGADIGGSHITAALVELETKKIFPGSLIRNSVNSHADAGHIIDAWCNTLSQVREIMPVEKLSLALPGPFDYDKGICLISNQDKYQSLYKLNVKQLLAEKMDVLVSNIYFNNDAACFLQGEVFCGALKEYDRALGITLGTGLGAAKYMNETSYDLSFWNLPFKDSIAEDYLSTRWFIARYFELSGRSINGVKELLELQGTDDQVIAMIFNEFGNNLIAFLQQASEIEGINAIVIGGNIANAFDLFSGALEAGIAEKFSNVLVEKALLGEEAALIGAASFWHKEHVGNIGF